MCDRIRASHKRSRPAPLAVLGPCLMSVERSLVGESFTHFPHQRIRSLLHREMLTAWFITCEILVFGKMSPDNSQLLVIGASQ